jgi:hypothetical protein
MNPINDSESVQAALAAALRTCVVSGIRATLPAVVDGLRVADKTPPSFESFEVSVSEIETAVAALSGQSKTRAELLLGLGEYQGTEASERRSLFARTWSTHYTWDNVRRTQQNLTLRQVAASWQGNRARTEPRNASVDDAGFGYDVMQYLAEHAFPEGRTGKRVTVHTRVIRALRDGFSEYRQQHVTQWPSGAKPELRLLSGGTLRIENFRDESINAVPGFRYDFFISFEPMAAGEERTLKWVREVDMGEGDMGVDGTIDAVEVTPTVRIHHAEMSVRFHRGLHPRVIWRFENALPGDRYLVPDVPDVLPTVNDASSASWEHLILGRASGIGWQW